VISLFTNIPIDLIIECLMNRWNLISGNCKIPEKEFLKAVELIFYLTCFSFDNQNFKTLMGSPLSPVIADIVMQELENTVLRSINFPIPIYYKYVDDIYNGRTNRHNH